MIENIFVILYSIVEITNIALCYTQILQAKLTTNIYKVCLVYGGIILCHVLNICMGSDIERAIINIVYCISVPLLFMEKERVKWLFLYPCATVLSSISGVVIIYFIAIIKNVQQSEVISSQYMDLMVNSAFMIIVGIVYIYRRVKNKGSKKLYFGNAVYAIVTFGTISFYLLIGLVQYLGVLNKIPTKQLNLLGLFLSLICVVFLLCFLWLSATIYKNVSYEKERDLLNMFVAEQEKHIELVIEKDKDIRKFRHDVKEHMRIISQYIKESEYDQAMTYIDKMYKVFSESEVKRYTGIIAVDAIISDKSKVMEEMGIKFIWEDGMKSELHHYDTFDLCTLFINIMNNAIDACEKLPEQDKEIGMTFKSKGDKIYILEKNKVNKEIVFDDEGNPVTTKTDKNKHGYGTKNIRSVVEKYDGMLKYSVKDNTFTVEIII